MSFESPEECVDARRSSLLLAAESTWASSWHGAKLLEVIAIEHLCDDADRVDHHLGFLVVAFTSLGKPQPGPTND